MSAGRVIGLQVFGDNTPTMETSSSLDSSAVAADNTATKPSLSNKKRARSAPSSRRIGNVTKKGSSESAITEPQVIVTKPKSTKQTSDRFNPPQPIVTKSTKVAATKECADKDAPKVNATSADSTIVGNESPPKVAASTSSLNVAGNECPSNVTANTKSEPALQGRRCKVAKEKPSPTGQLSRPNKLSNGPVIGMRGGGRQKKPVDQLDCDPEVADDKPAHEVTKNDKPSHEVANDKPPVEVASDTPSSKLAKGKPSSDAPNAPTGTDDKYFEVADDSPSPGIADQEAILEVADEKPSPEVADEKPSPEVADQKPSPEVAEEQPSPEVADQKPSNDVASDKPSHDVADDKCIPTLSQKESAAKLIGEKPVLKRNEEEKSTLKRAEKVSVPDVPEKVSAFKSSGSKAPRKST